VLGHAVIVQPDAGAPVIGDVVKRRVTFDARDAIDLDRLRKPVVKVRPRPDQRRAVLVLAGLHVAIGRRLDQNVDVFRKPVDDPVALRQRRAALQLKFEVELLEPVKAMHDPVVFFDQG
jgi:hypothetical protein